MKTETKKVYGSAANHKHFSFTYNLADLKFLLTNFVVG